MGRWVPHTFHYRRSLASRVTWLTTIAVVLTVTGVAFAAYATVRMQSLHSLDDSLHSRAAQAAHADTLDALSREEIPPWALGAADVKIVFLDAVNGTARPDNAASAADEISRSEMRVALGRQSWSARTVLIDGERYRMVAVPAQTGEALILAQSLEPTDRMLDRLGLVMLLFGLAGSIAAGLAGLGGGPQRTASRTPPDHRGRGDRAHRAARPDPGRGARRGGPPRDGLQLDAHGPVRLPGPAAPAGGRRRPRAAHAADLAAHQPRPAGPGGQLDPALRRVAAGAPGGRARPDPRDDHPDRRPRRARPRGPEHRPPSSRSSSRPWSARRSPACAGVRRRSSSSCTPSRGGSPATPLRSSARSPTCSTTPPSGARPGARSRSRSARAW